MYLHLGNQVIALQKSVIGVFDMDTATWSHRTRETLEKLEQAGQVENAAGADFKTLHDTAKKIDDVTKTMNTILEGMPEDLDCASCSFKPVCDEVEGLKELHFGKAGKKAPEA